MPCLDNFVYEFRQGLYTSTSLLLIILKFNRILVCFSNARPILCIEYLVKGSLRRLMRYSQNRVSTSLS